METQVSEKKVIVVMPAYNHERFVGAAIESVLQQTCRDLELIIIDDGSKDRTGEIARSYQDPRVAYTCQLNQDAYNALNRGLKTARGEFGCYIVSQGDIKPYRIKLRVPSFGNLSILPEIAVDTLVADLVAILGSVDVVIPEIAR